MYLATGEGHELFGNGVVRAVLQHVRVVALFEPYDDLIEFLFLFLFVVGYFDVVPVGRDCLGERLKRHSANDQYEQSF